MTTTQSATKPKPATSGFVCMECGHVFKTHRAAEKAFFGAKGCPKCGGSDIDLGDRKPAPAPRTGATMETKDETKQPDGSRKLWPGETKLVVAIAWHLVGLPGEERTLVDEDGENVPDRDEVLVGVFTTEELARTGAEAYAKEHNAAVAQNGEDHSGSGIVDGVTLHEASFNVHGTGPWLNCYDPETGKWEN